MQVGALLLLDTKQDRLVGVPESSHEFYITWVRRAPRDAAVKQVLCGGFASCTVDVRCASCLIVDQQTVTNGDKIPTLSAHALTYPCAPHCSLSRAQRFVKAMDSILHKIISAHSASARRDLRPMHVFGGDKLVPDFTQQVRTSTSSGSWPRGGILFFSFLKHVPEG